MTLYWLNAHPIRRSEYNNMNDARAKAGMLSLPFEGSAGSWRQIRPQQMLTCMACLALLCLFAFSIEAADVLNWNTNRNLVSADITAGKLPTLLEEIAATTGWQVFVEPELDHTVSAKFKNLKPGDALHLLLGELNFALVPETNAIPHLFVFRTSRSKATQLVAPLKIAKGVGPAKAIPNELIVRLKPGAKIDDLAKLLGAKVIGRIDGLNAYRLQFDDAAAANAAREQLAGNSDVASVENNYSIDRPTTPREALSTTVPPPHLQLNPPPDSGKIIVGLVDTAVQPLGNNLDGFLLKQLSVAGDATLDPNSPTHGTAMAETILRSLEMSTKGNTSVQILPVDVYGPNESTSTFDVALGIIQAVNNGAKILNLSLGSPGDSQMLSDLIKEVSGKNILIFAAKGNEPVTTPFYPAADPGAIAVTALDRGQLAPYANLANIPSVGAPGTSVVYYNGQPYYVVGTSVSTAYVSGMAGGYMDVSHKGTSDAQTFILNNLSIKPGGK